MQLTKLRRHRRRAECRLCPAGRWTGHRFAADPRCSATLPHLGGERADDRGVLFFSRSHRRFSSGSLHGRACRRVDDSIVELKSADPQARVGAALMLGLLVTRPRSCSRSPCPYEGPGPSPCFVRLPRDIAPKLMRCGRHLSALLTDARRVRVRPLRHWARRERRQRGALVRLCVTWTPTRLESLRHSRPSKRPRSAERPRNPCLAKDADADVRAPPNRY